MKTDWKPDTSLLCNRHAAKALTRDCPAEWQSCMVNLGRVLDELNAGKPLSTFRFGFFRSEGRGLYRIGQTAVSAARELRLYVFPDARTRTLYLLAFGTKRTQQGDIAACRSQARHIGRNMP
jgi:hypothetical protein